MAQEYALSSSTLVGVTTAPRADGAKRHDYLTPSLLSLTKAGWQPPHVFAEPDSNFTALVSAGVSSVYRNADTLGCYANWKQGLTHLLRLADDMNAECLGSCRWLLMLQDDVIWSDKTNPASLYAAVHSVPRPEQVGAFSWYTSPSMVGTDDTGFVHAALHKHSFWGALALMFPIESARRLLTAPRFVNHPKDCRLDVVIGNTLSLDLCLRLLVHNPSLCDHIGAFSTLGRHKIKGIQSNRRGHMFA